MAKLRITYRGESPPPPDVVTLGAFAQIAAKRRYGLEATKSDDPEVALFGCFVEIAGPQKAAEPEAFDEWLFTIDTFGVEATDPNDPTPAETPSSDTSPESPPTSD